jgi:tetratricopeptide (TPR) repeat protein
MSFFRKLFGAKPRPEGTSCFDAADLDSAIVAFTEAIRLNPKSAAAYCRRGGAYGRKGDHDKAIDDFTVAIHLDPKYADAYCNRGLTHLREGRSRQCHRRLQPSPSDQPETR